jgi:hypothetical protein
MNRITTSLKRLHGMLQFGGLLALIAASVLLFTGSIVVAVVSDEPSVAVTQQR